MKRTNQTPSQAGTQLPARRRFIQTVFGATAALTVPSVWASMPETQERSLVFSHLHTGETLKATFWADGEYLHDEIAAINKLLRDHRSGDIHAMDKQLFDQMYLLQQSTGVKGSFQIISGYRSPATNEKLRVKSSGVARRSLHMQGRAIDIRLPGCKLKDLRNAALDLKAGGVGYYARSNFIHIDTGRVRRW
jgi:uncharacterized protein YcbK (DUF882 family)